MCDFNSSPLLQISPNIVVMGSVFSGRNSTSLSVYHYSLQKSNLTITKLYSLKVDTGFAKDHRETLMAATQIGDFSVEAAEVLLQVRVPKYVYIMRMVNKLFDYFLQKHIMVLIQLEDGSSLLVNFSIDGLTIGPLRNSEDNSVALSSSPEFKRLESNIREELLPKEKTFKDLFYLMKDVELRNYNSLGWNDKHYCRHLIEGLQR